MLLLSLLFVVVLLIIDFISIMLQVSGQCPSDGGGGKTLDGGSSDLYQQIKHTSPKMVRRDSLPLIETRDAEVNAPLYNRGLLQGEELLGALDQSMNKVPSQLDFHKMQQE